MRQERKQKFELYLFCKTKTAQIFGPCYTQRRTWRSCSK